ncbi:MAG TPA: hypothetical protein VHC20_02715 [Candidatus Paceibacterota bacterium]|nr:hypothetical protein [Candidatus Paceibacterota bacterium]
MAALSQEQPARTLVVILFRVITLRRADLSSDASPMDLMPGKHEFFIQDFADGRTHKRWVLLTEDKQFGIPLAVLKTHDEANRAETRDAAGRLYDFE